MVENYVCEMHGKFRYSSVEKARLDMLMEIYQPKEKEKFYFPASKRWMATHYYAEGLFCKS